MGACCAAGTAAGEMRLLLGCERACSLLGLQRAGKRLLGVRALDASTILRLYATPNALLLLHRPRAQRITVPELTTSEPHEDEAGEDTDATATPTMAGTAVKHLGEAP